MKNKDRVASIIDELWDSHPDMVTERLQEEGLITPDKSPLQDILYQQELSESKKLYENGLYEAEMESRSLGGGWS